MEIVICSLYDGMQILVNDEIWYSWDHNDMIGLGLDDFLQKLLPDSSVRLEEVC